MHFIVILLSRNQPLASFFWWMPPQPYSLKITRSIPFYMHGSLIFANDPSNSVYKKLYANIFSQKDLTITLYMNGTLALLLRNDWGSSFFTCVVPSVYSLEMMPSIPCIWMSLSPKSLGIPILSYLYLRGTLALLPRNNPTNSLLLWMVLCHHSKSSHFESILPHFVVITQQFFLKFVWYEWHPNPSLIDEPPSISSCNMHDTSTALSRNETCSSFWYVLDPPKWNCHLLFMIAPLYSLEVSPP